MRFRKAKAIFIERNRKMRKFLFLIPVVVFFLPLYGTENHPSLIPVNPAEGILIPCWDSNMADVKQWETFSSSGKSSISYVFGAVRLTVRDHFRIRRKVSVRADSFDRLLVSILLEEGRSFVFRAETDAGIRERRFRVLKGDAVAEYALELNGAKKISSIELEFDGSSSPMNPVLNWIGTADSAALPYYERYIRQLQEIDFDRFVKTPEQPSFRPLFGLIAPEEAIKRARLRFAHSYRVQAERERERLLSVPLPKMLGEFLPVDRRFPRDRDYARLRYWYFPHRFAWLGMMLKDPELMKQAVRSAVIFAHFRSWGVGMYATLPGSSFEHRAFDESRITRSLLLTMDFAGEFMTNETKELLMRCIAERGVNTVNYSAWKFEYIYHCNQLAWFSAGRIGGYLLMEKYGWKRTAPYMDLALAELRESLDRFVLEPDGGFHEGSSYFQATAARALESFYMASLARKIPFETILPESLKNSVRYADLMISTDESQGFFPTHDGNGSINAGEYPAVAFLAAMFPRSSWGRLYNRLLRTARNFPINDYYIQLLMPEKPYPEPPYPVFTRIDSISSVASTRMLDGYPVRIALLADAQAFHAHEDLGQFLIEAGGETFAADSGILSYSHPLCNELKKSYWHNVLYPKGNPDLQPNKTSLKLNAKGDEKVFEASVNLQPAFPGIFRRRVRSLRSDSPGNLTIRDKYSLLEESNGVRFNWMTPLPVFIQGRHVEIRGRLFTLSFTVPEDWKLSCKKRERAEGYSPLNCIMMDHSSLSGELELNITIQKNPTRQESAL